MLFFFPSLMLIERILCVRDSVHCDDCRFHCLIISVAKCPTAGNVLLYTVTQKKTRSLYGNLGNRRPFYRNIYSVTAWSIFFKEERSHEL